MNIFKHGLEDLTKDEITLLESYFHGYDYHGAGYTLLANYIWRNTHCLCWEVIGDYLCFAGADCMIGEPNAIMAMPLTRDGAYDPDKLRETILAAKARFDQRKIAFSLVTPGHTIKDLEAAFPGQLAFDHDRDSDEYVYLKDKLITLSGRALHKKKNHMNYFLKNYQYETRKICGDMVDSIMSFVVQLKSDKSFDADEMDSLDMEEEAIGEALRYIDRPEIYSTAIFIEDQLVAFAIGERLSEDTAVEHFEKADDRYRGLYQVICSEFCKTLPAEVVYVNREEDMGLMNLRQAKEALRPDHMEEKYSCCFLSE